MTKVQDLLLEIGRYHHSVRKSLVANRYRALWIEQASKQADAVRQLLRDSDLSAELDSLLSVLHRELDDSQVAKDAIGVISEDLAGFIRAEARLHQLTHVNSKTYAEVVAEVRPWIVSSAHPDFPRTTSDFLREFDALDHDFRRTMKEVPNLPRSLSKTRKGEFGWKFWRYSVGSLITIANVYFSYHQQSFAGMGVTSVTVGAWYFNRRNGGPRKPPTGVSGDATSREILDKQG